MIERYKEKMMANDYTLDLWDRLLEEFCTNSQNEYYVNHVIISGSLWLVTIIIRCKKNLLSWRLRKNISMDIPPGFDKETRPNKVKLTPFRLNQFQEHGLAGP